MPQYNLTKKQHEFLKFLINGIEEGVLDEEFWVIHTLKEISLRSPSKQKGYKFPPSESPQAVLDALKKERMITCTKHSKGEYRYVVTQKAYNAAKSDLN